MQMINDIEKEIDKDTYINKKRRTATISEEKQLLQEANFRCALCGKRIQNSKNNTKKNTKLYEIAHIYPCKPTAEQYITLKGLQRLGDDNQTYNNMIILCKDCHSNFDNHTTKEEYEKLVSIKLEFMNNQNLEDSMDNLYIEKEIIKIINKIKNISSDNILELKYFPVEIKNKIDDSNYLLKKRVIYNVEQYYPLIKKHFESIDGMNNFSAECLYSEIRAAYFKAKATYEEKEQIYNELKKWIRVKSNSKDETAIDVLVSFFVQNCEVFDEITK